MCALIAMAVHDTEENKRTELTKRTLVSLRRTGLLHKHRMIIVDNNSCEETKELLKTELTVSTTACYIHDLQVITLPKNLGTAEAINLAWKTRLPGENTIKMDNDVEIDQIGWVDEMEEALRRDSTLGIVGLKRKDCWENPAHEDPFYKSELIMLPHKPGERWMIIEKVNHVMGTCQMYSSALLDKIGYLYQPRLYGFDDSLASARSKAAGFYNAFLPHIQIDHIDPGTTPYQKWKEHHASEQWAEYGEALLDYRQGKNIYYNPFQS